MVGMKTSLLYIYKLDYEVEPVSTEKQRFWLSGQRGTRTCDLRISSPS